jgi:hypothetical protein
VLRHSLTGLDCDNPVRLIRHLDEVAQPGLEDCDLCVDILSLFRLEHIGKLGFACEQVQDGVSSRMFTAGYLAPMEQPSADVSRYVTRRLGARHSWRAD